MTPRTKKRASLFPAYTPPEQENPTVEVMAEHLGTYIQALAKRIIAFGSLLLMVTGGGAYAAHIGESKPVDAATERVKALEDSVNAHSRRFDNDERLLRANIYVTCQVLFQVAPAKSITPDQCR